MKITACLMVLLATAAGSLAQVSVDVYFEQEQFLRNESLPIKVRISNSSGQTLRLGGDADWISFQVEDQEGHAVRRLAPVPPAAPFVLPSAKVANLRFDLMPSFELGTMGRYSLTVVLQTPQLGRTFSAPVRHFDIINGTKLWERDFGVPAAGVPEMRRYALQQAAFLKQLRLYVRVTDASEEKVFRVVPLGLLVSFSKPEALLDKSSNLHVLFQNSAHLFLYHIIAPDGEIIIRQTFEFFETRPTLRSLDGGGIYVAGGRRRVLLSDLPPPPEEPPPPPDTNSPPLLSRPTNAAPAPPAFH